MGPDVVVSSQASPSPEMSICETANMVSLANRLVAKMKDINNALPLERQDMIRTTSDDEAWETQALLNRLVHRRLGVPDDTSLID